MTEAGSGDEGSLSGLRILIAEDMPVNRLLLCSTLDQHGGSADVAANGQEAVAMAGAQDYDIIFLDCQMPLMDGLEAARQIRQAEEKSGQRATLIALTADTSEADRARCAEAGMDDFLGKPFTSEQIVAVLQKGRRP